MRHRTWIARLGLMAALLSGGSAALAKDPPSVPGAPEVAAARAAAKAGRLEEAGAELSKALAAAIKAKSLEGEERAGEALDAILEEAAGAAAGSGAERMAKQREAYRAVTVPVCKGLDGKRHGLFVSAHALALGLVLDAIAAGDARGLPEADAALKAFAATPKAGAAAAAFGQLSRGVVAARAGDAATATSELTAAAAACEVHGWLRPGLYARLELCAVQVAKQDQPAALESLKAAVASVPRESDASAAREWVMDLESRLKDAPPEALEALRAVVKPLTAGPASAGAAGGRGGHGTNPGDQSPLGKGLPKLGAGKPFVTVKRTSAGFLLDVTLDDDSAAELPLDPGQVTWDASGVTLVLAGPAVSLRMLDHVGDRGQPGGQSSPSRAWAYYWLAEGESFGAAKNGVEISGQASARTPR